MEIPVSRRLPLRRFNIFVVHRSRSPASLSQGQTPHDIAGAAIQRLLSGMQAVQPHSAAHAADVAEWVVVETLRDNQAHANNVRLGYPARFSCPERRACRGRRLAHAPTHSTTARVRIISRAPVLLHQRLLRLDDLRRTRGRRSTGAGVCLRGSPQRTSRRLLSHTWLILAAAADGRHRGRGFSPRQSPSGSGS